MEFNSSPRSPEKGDEIVEIMSAIKSRMSKKAADRRKKTHADCELLSQQIGRESKELFDLQDKILDDTVSEYEEEIVALNKERSGLMAAIKHEAVRYERAQHTYLDQVLSGARMHKQLLDEMLKSITEMNANVGLSDNELTLLNPVKRKSHLPAGLGLPTPEASTHKRRRIVTEG